MNTPISIRLDDDVRAELEALARKREMPLATLVRDLARQAAEQARAVRIYEASAKIGQIVATDPEAAAFYQDWGTPTAHG